MTAKYLMIDGFCHPGPYTTRQPGDPYSMDDLLAEHARMGVAARVCLHSESRDGFAPEGNREMSRLAASHPDTAAIWTVLPSRRLRAEPVEKMMAEAQNAGVAMFALYPKIQQHHLASWANGELYRAMEEARVPLAVEMGQAGYGEIYDLARAHPRMPIILWNSTYADERAQIPVLDSCPNVHVGIAGRFIPTDAVEEYTKRYGPGRLIFGSTWPAQSPGPMITFVTYANVSDEAKAAILGSNIRRLISEVRWKVRGSEGWPS